MSLDNAIGLMAGIIMSIGLVSVLFYGFRIQDYPKKWKKELDERYVPELLRKKKKKEEEEKNTDVVG